MKRFGIAILVALVTLPLARVASAGADYKGGFLFTSEDGNYSLKINGGITPRLQFTKSSTTPKVLSFSVRSASLSFSSNVKKASFGFSLSHASNSRNFSTVNVGGLTMSYEFAPQFILSAGQVGLPLDNTWFLLPDPPLTVTQSDGTAPLTVTRDSFGAPDGLGLQGSGDIGKFFYAMGIVNASESNYQVNTTNMRMSFGAKIGVNILGAVGGLSDYANSASPNLTVSGGSVYQGRRIDQETAWADAGLVAPEVDYIWTQSAGAAFQWRGFSLSGEIYNRYINFRSFGGIPVALQHAVLNDFAYAGVVGYYVIPKKLELALQASQVFREGPDNNANQFGGGVIYYFDRKVKLSTNYSWTEDYDDIAGTRSNNRHLAQVQFGVAF